MLQAILFDVDGTLAETERDGHRVAFNQAFAEAGLNWSWSVEVYGALLAITGGKERIRHFIDKYKPDYPAQADEAAWIAGLHQAKTTHYLRLLADGAIPLRPGVRRLLDEARAQGLRLAIVTTTTPENVTGLLAATLGEESIAWFEVIAAGDIVPKKKPAGDIYVYTLAQLQLPAEACLAIEDSSNGVLSALDAGIAVLVTENAYTCHDNFRGALAVLSDLGEPGEKVQTLAGPAPAKGWVDCAYLQALMDEHGETA
jgi:HAD superfamily hydrolase (TIGR01509 family)